MFKISGNFLTLIALYFLGYTHFLGGPYGLAKFFFILMIIGSFGFYFILLGLSLFTGRIIGKRIKFFSSKKYSQNKEETIKVDAKIIE